MTCLRCLLVGSLVAIYSCKQPDNQGLTLGFGKEARVIMSMSVGYTGIIASSSNIRIAFVTVDIRGASQALEVNGRMLVRADAFSHVSFSSDPTERLAYAARTGQAWSVFLDGKVLLAGLSEVGEIIWGPAGDLFVTGVRNGKAFLWRNGKELATGREISNVAISDDGKRVACVVFDGEWRVWHNGEFESGYQRIGPPQFLRNGISYIASYGLGSLVVAAGKELATHDQVEHLRCSTSCDEPFYIARDEECTSLYKGGVLVYRGQGIKNWLLDQAGRSIFVAHTDGKDVLYADDRPIRSHGSITEVSILEGGEVAYIYSDGSRDVLATLTQGIILGAEQLVGPIFGIPGMRIGCLEASGQRLRVVWRGGGGPWYDRVSKPVVIGPTEVVYCGVSGQDVFLQTDRWRTPMGEWMLPAQSGSDVVNEIGHRKRGLCFHGKRGSYTTLVPSPWIDANRRVVRYLVLTPGGVGIAERTIP